ncbi:MAG: universal stress protein [Gemmatimonadota bacterium]
MYERIIVPIAGRRPEGEAYGLGYATLIARRTGANVELVHVHRPQWTTDPVESVTPYRFEQLVPWNRAYERAAVTAESVALTEIADRIADRSGVTVATNVLYGPVAATIGDHAAQRGADLIVVGVDRSTESHRAWAGSVPDALVRLATVPVLLVPAWTAAAVEEEEPKLRRILLPLDGSDLSRQILVPVRRLARALEAEVSLVRVVPPATAGARDAARETAGTASAELRAVARELEGHGIATTARVIAHEEPARGILEETTSGDIDLIAMATHGRSGLKRFVLGSCAEAVLRSATAPVLMYRPDAPRAEPGGGGVL